MKCISIPLSTQLVVYVVSQPVVKYLNAPSPNILPSELLLKQNIDLISTLYLLRNKTK